MAPLPRPTCAVCGAPLPGPVDAIGSSARCPKCDTALGPSSEIDEKKPRPRPQPCNDDTLGEKTGPLPRPADPNETAQSWPPASDDTLHVPAPDGADGTIINPADSGRTLDFDPAITGRDPAARLIEERWSD